MIKDSELKGTKHSALTPLSMQFCFVTVISKYFKSAIFLRIY